MTSKRVISTALAAVAAGAIVLAGAAAPAMAASKTCAKHPGAVLDEGFNAGNSRLRAWHSKGSLYTCTVRGFSLKSDKARTRKLGRWTSASRLFIDGDDASWTVRKTVGGTAVDRISTRNMWTGISSQSDLPLVPASGATLAREAQLYGWTAYDQTLAWVTKVGDVVLAADDPSDTPTPRGALPAPLAPDGKRLLVASYPTANSLQLEALRESLHLFSLGGDGDECDTVYDATLTFVDAATFNPLGVTWSVDSHNSLC